jgi:pimeloyl-ACP methyl ester carboxylesterase
MQFERQGLTFDVRDGGGDGEPVVLLHGFPQTSRCWLTIEPTLRRAGVRTLAPDQRGYSPGARPVGRRKYQISALTDDVLALLDQAGLASAHVVGHDWGGLVGWALAGLHPDRVRSLTVLSTPHPGAFVRSMRGSQALKSWYMLFFQLPWLPERAISAGLEMALTRSGLPADAVQRDLPPMSQLGALTGALNWYRAMPFWLRRPIPRVDVPTSFVWGRKDSFLGRTSAELTGEFVKGSYRFVELDAGHWLPDTHPNQVADVILDRVRSVRSD